MKKFSKILSVALLVALVLSLGVTSAFADHTITIKRDSSWGQTTEGDGATVTSKEATYTWYRIFDAEITGTLPAVDPATGALPQGTAAGNVVYTISNSDADVASAKVAALASLFDAQLASDGKYYMTLKNSNTTAAQIVALLDDVIADNPDLFDHNSVTSHENPVNITVSDGYYFIKASNGSNLAVQTVGDVTINEKNDYPKLDKQEKKANGSWIDTTVMPAELNTYIDYKLEVKVPADANQPIYVYDKMTTGLTYDSTTGLTAKIDGTDVSFTDIPSSDTKHYVAGQTWQIKFDTDVVSGNNLGKTITITYRALVNDSTLEVDERNNTATLKYDDNNYVITDHVDYTTYFTGIEKVDGATKTVNGDIVTYTKKLENVKFTLTQKAKDAAADAAGTSFNVQKATDENGEDLGYYIPGGSSNVVITDKDGKIIIRGLDGDFDYFLTETETNDGYNLLSGEKKLRLVEDKTDTYPVEKFDIVENNSGTQLPSTGGIGTTIFYVVGGVLVLAAIILLVTKKRMSE